MRTRKPTSLFTRAGNVFGLSKDEKGRAVRLSKKINSLLVRRKLTQEQAKALQAYIQLFKLKRGRTPRMEEISFAFQELKL